MFINRLFWSAYLLDHLRGQARYPFKPLKAIKRDEARRVHTMVTYAYRHVPYYRETMHRLGLQPSNLQSAADLAKLPLLERDQLQRDPEYFVSTAQRLDHYLRLRTGGSTGAPRSVYHDARSLFQNRAHAERERSIIIALIGKSLGYCETEITSPLAVSRKVGQFYQTYGFFPRGARRQWQHLSILDPPDQNVRLINEFKPDVIESYGSYLAIMFAYVQKSGIEFHRPKAIVYTSDDLPESVRHLIEWEFSIPVFSTYGAAEAFKIGFECEHHLGLHLNIDLNPVRIVDANGQPLPDGESGDVVVSELGQPGYCTTQLPVGRYRCHLARSMSLRPVVAVTFIPTGT